jgi:hypothetical protein
MIYGTKFWNDIDCFHIQDNNTYEETFRKKGVQYYLETCGSTSAINCISSMKGDDFFDNIRVGDFYPQPEDILTAYFNTKTNYNLFKQIRADIDYTSMMVNEVPQIYPIAIKTLFGIDCEFKWEKDWNKLIEYLKNGMSIQVCEPGHYTGVVAYDGNTNELIYNDPWNGHHSGGGFNLRYSKDYYDQSINNFIIVYKG